MIKPFYKIKKKLVLLFGVFTVIGGRLIAQVSVSGPQCIVPGITYQYVINGNWNASSTLQVCITGGTLSAGTRCTPQGAIESSILIVWSDTTYHRLSVASSLGDTNLTVQTTTDLKGGEINESDKVKLYDSTIANYTFRCEEAHGGSCTSSYSYQWQRSDNALNWTDINGATGRDLQFSEGILVNTFFRRVTTETNSKTVAYSDIGILTVPF